MAGRKWYAILMAIWFLLWGLLAITSFKFDQSDLILGLLAIVIFIAWCFDK